MGWESKKWVYLGCVLVVVIAAVFLSHSVSKFDATTIKPKWDGENSTVGNRDIDEPLSPVKKSPTQQADKLSSAKNAHTPKATRAPSHSKPRSNNPQLNQRMASLHRQVNLPRFSQQISGLEDVARERAAAVLEFHYRDHLVNKSSKQDLDTLSENMDIDPRLVGRYLGFDDSYQDRKKEFEKAQTPTQSQERSSVIVSEKELAALDRQRNHYKTLLAMQIATKLSQQEASLINN